MQLAREVVRIGEAEAAKKLAAEHEAPEEPEESHVPVQHRAERVHNAAHAVAGVVKDLRDHPESLDDLVRAVLDLENIGGKRHF